MWQRYNQTSHIFEKSVDNGASWAPMPINGAGIEGTIPNVAYINSPNNFNTRQIITAGGSPQPHYNLELLGGPGAGGDHPGIVFNSTNQAVDARKFRIISYVGLLRFEGLNDAETATNPGMSLDRAGNLSVANHIVSGHTIRSTGDRGAPPGAGGGIELFFQSGQGYIHTYDITTAGYPNLVLYSSDVNIAKPGCNLHVNGNIFNSGGYIYPGRADSAGAEQVAWYLGSHASYGLYTNTGLYVAGSLWVANNINVSGVMNMAVSVWHQSTDGWQRLNFSPSGPTYIKGASITFRRSTTGMDDYDIATISSSGGLRVGAGFGCRAGVNADGYAGHFNFNWTGAAIQCWIDATHIGNIAFAATVQALEQRVINLENR